MVISFRPQVKYDQQASVILLTSGQKNKHLKEGLEKGEIFPFFTDKSKLIFVGLGKADKLTLTELRIQVRKTLLSSYLKRVKNIELIPHTKMIQRSRPSLKEF